MGIKAYKPTSPGRRGMTVSDFAEITATEPKKSLTRGTRKSGGRNSSGRITTRFRGGGNKRRFREIDFQRNKEGIPATVKSIEYDPNRTARIALICYADGVYKYVLATSTMEVGDVIMNGPTAELKAGNCLKLKDIPVGQNIHCIELYPKQGAKMVRSAGQYAVLRSKDETYAQVKLPSGEVRMVHLECRATMGIVSNGQHSLIKIGKAGKVRYKGKRPHVRGVAMNPVDHPMGGGEGKTSGGGHPQSPWGQLAKGKKTRKKSKTTSKFIVVDRRKN